MNFSQSNDWLENALKTIPIGSQTFSKSYYSLPLGVSPLFVESGQGCMVTDIDGNVFCDFVNGLLAISLGYCDEDVDTAVKQQLAKGVSFSLPHRLEAELAQKLTELIPCAEMVRYGKNGSDATSAAIRLARAVTGKEHVAVCGYHGWQDWYIGSTSRNLGVPKSVQSLTHGFKFNDIESLEQAWLASDKQLAAVIMEPMNVAYPAENFLQNVRAFCDRNDIILIFDETITGFRFSLGGAQSLFDVTPDLATFGKGMANGYPISAVVGRAKIMKYMEDIFFSGTFGGETLSISAALATINKIESLKVCEQINDLGTYLIEGVNALIKKYDLESYFSISGHPSWSFLHIADGLNNDAVALKSLFIQKMIENNILIMGSHNLSFSHKKVHIDHLLKVYEHVLPEIQHIDKSNSFDSHFNGELIKAVFKVR